MGSMVLIYSLISMSMLPYQEQLVQNSGYKVYVGTRMELTKDRSITRLVLGITARQRK